MVTTLGGVRKKRFSPYIYVQTAERQTGFFSYSKVEALQRRYLEVPEGIVAEALERQLAMVGRMARAHFAEQRGVCHPFGPITGYIYRWCEEDSIALDTAGEVLEEHGGRFAEDGKTVAYLNGQPLEVMVVRY